MTIFFEMVQKRRLQQGFCQNHARTSYSWSPVPGRAGFSSTHWILWANPKLWQTCPTWGLFLGSQKQAFLASWLWALIVYIYLYIIMFNDVILIHVINVPSLCWDFCFLVWEYSTTNHMHLPPFQCLVQAPRPRWTWSRVGRWAFRSTFRGGHGSFI